MFHSTKRALAGFAALAALALGGSAIAGAASSSSTTTGTSTATGTSSVGTSSGTSGTQTQPGFNGPAHGTAAHEDAEKAVTGDTASKAQAAAVKAVGGGTAGAVTSDFTGSGYETTVTKSDDTKVEVHLDGSYSVMQGPGGQGGGPGVPPSGGSQG